MDVVLNTRTLQFQEKTPSFFLFEKEGSKVYKPQIRQQSFMYLPIMNR